MNHAWHIIKSITPFLLILVMILWLRQCSYTNSEGDRYKDNLEILNGDIRDLELSNGELVSERDLLLVTGKELRNQVWMKDDTIAQLLKKVKDPTVVVKWRTKTEFDTIKIPFELPVSGEFHRTFNKTEEWYSVSGMVNQNGINFSSISIPNTQRLVVGYRKGNPVVRITNSNPFIHTEDIQGQVIDIPKRRWVIGVGGSWNYFQDPYFGIFAGYKLFEF